MGEIAERMLSGEDCEACGEYIGAEDYGIPMYCSIECAQDRGADESQVVSPEHMRKLYRSMGM